MLDLPTMMSRNQLRSWGVQWRLVHSRRMLHAGRAASRLTSTVPWALVERERPWVANGMQMVPASVSRRTIHIPPVILPPVVFTGLLVALWIWYAPGRS